MMMTTETLEKMTVGYVVHGLNNSKAIALKKEYFSINYRSDGSAIVHNGLVLLDHQLSYHFRAIWSILKVHFNLTKYLLHTYLIWK